MDLTPRQEEVLIFIKSFSSSNGFPPTRAEISKHFGFASSNAAEEHVRALERKKAITVAKNVSRGIVVIDGLA